ncbi:MAG: IS66 family transposase [Lachnospiraceae bacterium]|nr:IS66 family transposase [Lachnospiraceae bacterium]
MDQKLTPDKLNGLPKEALILLIMSMQDQLTALNSRLDDLTEQIRVANNQRFGRSTEKLEQFSGQGFFDPDGNLYFNETEAILDRSGEPAEPTFEEATRRRTPRQKGKKESDLSAFPVIQLPTIDVPEEDRIREFGSLDNCRRMKDEVFRRLIYIPAGWKVEETHVAVYRSKKGPARFLKGETPAYLLRGSVVTPSLEAAIINGKFVNALPYRRMEKDFERNGVFISEQNMASWTIKCADRYLSRLYDYMHKLLIPQHVLHADETTVEVSKDGRKAGSKSYMWIYRTGKHGGSPPIILYEYQKTRNHEHPLEFLRGFAGYVVCDAFSGYKTLMRAVEGIGIAECWAHSRRKFSDAAKAAKGTSRATIAVDALQMIASIYHAENKLQELSCEERQKQRDKKVRPLVDAFFAWIHKTADDKTLLLTEDTRKGIQYCINQEQYLREFLNDGEIPLDNNLAESSIRSFTVGRRNWLMIDTVSGAKASAVIYSIVETAKANNLNPYYYFEHLLTEIPKLKEFNTPEEEAAAMERLLPWSADLPEKCHKRSR